MKAIYKYPLNVAIINQEQKVDMPEGAQILSAGFQGEELVVWAKVLTSNEVRKEQRSFCVCFTGPELPEMLWHEHLVTLQHRGFVFHVFYIRRI